MINTNEKTGVRFGYISANSLDYKVVYEMLYIQGTDYSYKEYLEEFPEETINNYENDEPYIEGEMDGVKYSTSWMGGALCFFILESPHQTTCALCSPCVPNAGDLNNIGDDYTTVSYDVPKDWRLKNE